MTTIDQETKTLGDCILHLTHHPMEQECWDSLIQFYDDHFDHPWITKAAEEQRKNPKLKINQGLVDFYKFEYEQRLLNHFMRTGEL